LGLLSPTEAVIGTGAVAQSSSTIFSALWYSSKRFVSSAIASAWSISASYSAFFQRDRL
jgi:hypothetical protein